MVIDPRLSEVYTDKTGNVWYQFANDAQMTYKRFMSAQIAERFMRMGLTDAFLKRIIDTGLELCFDKSRNEQQLRQDMSVIFQNIKMRHGYVASEEQYLRMAAVFFLLPDEPVDDVYESYTQRKIEIWSKDRECKDFFLHRAFVRMNNLPSISIEDMQELLTIAAEREMNIPTLPQVSVNG